MPLPPHRPLAGALLAALLSLPLLANGCGPADKNGAFRELAAVPLSACCTDFRPGADMTVTDFGVDGSIRAPYAAYAQATGDYVVAANYMATEVTAACRNIALDFGGNDNDAAVRGRAGEEASFAWCNLAVRKLQTALSDTLQAGGHLAFDFAPPVCVIDETYLLRCENGCSTDVSCQEKGVVGRCEAAKIVGVCTAKCGGACIGSPTAAATCEGKCDSECQGTCAGDCSGMCEGVSQIAGGRCRGTCIGQCDGFCKGRCTGTCHFSKGASGKCDGACQGGCGQPMKSQRFEADLKPPTCATDPNCEANCKASGQARASCSPPSLAISVSNDPLGAPDVLTLFKSLETNLPILFNAAKARGPQLETEAKLAFEAGGTIVKDQAKLGPKGTACALSMQTAGETTLQNLHFAMQASATLIKELPVPK